MKFLTALDSYGGVGGGSVFLEVSRGSLCTVGNHELIYGMSLTHPLRKMPQITSDSCLDLIPIEIFYGLKGCRCGSWDVFGNKEG